MDDELTPEEAEVLAPMWGRFIRVDPYEAVMRWAEEVAATQTGPVELSVFDRDGNYLGGAEALED